MDNLYHFPCSEKSRLLSVYKADASNQRESETVFSTMLLLFTERCSVAGSARFYESYYVQVSASYHAYLIVHNKLDNNKYSYSLLNPLGNIEFNAI